MRRRTSFPTLTLIEALRATGNRAHVVFASSGGAVYGDAANRRPFREDDACRPQTSYGIQKLTAEHYLRMASEHGWLTATTLRVANPYGVLLPPERRQGFIGTAVAQIRAGDPVRVFGNPANVRDYVHIADVCRAFELALVAARAVRRLQHRQRDGPVRRRRPRAHAGDPRAIRCPCIPSRSPRQTS